jgi:hypothetical protein
MYDPILVVVTDVATGYSGDWDKFGLGWTFLAWPGVCWEQGELQHKCGCSILPTDITSL